MDGAAAHAFTAVVPAELDGVFSGADPVVGPVELLLGLFIRGEFLQGPPEGAGVEGHHGEAGLGQFCGQGAPAGAGADDGKIDFFGIGEAAHGEASFPAGARPGPVRCGGLLVYDRSWHLPRLPGVMAVGPQPDIPPGGGRPAEADFVPGCGMGVIDGHDVKNHP